MKTIQQKRLKWQEKKEKLENKYSLMEQKKQFFKSHRRFKLPSTSKILVSFLFLTCTLIMIFTGWITYQSLQLAEKIMIAPDYTPLVTLIGAVVGEVFSFGVYSLKAMKENTKGGIIYEKTISEQVEQNQDGSVG